jgi:hypothetical protein
MKIIPKIVNDWNSLSSSCYVLQTEDLLFCSMLFDWFDLHYQNRDMGLSNRKRKKREQ